MNTLEGMQNMTEVIQWIEAETPFSAAFQKKVLGSIRRMEGLPHYGIPLSQIPADLEIFDASWPRGPVRSLPNGFKSTSSFADWRSQVRSALNAFNGTPKAAVPAAFEDAWSHLMAQLKGAGVPDQKIIPVKALANAARQASVKPSDITMAWLQKAVDTADSTGRHQAINIASKLIHKHRASLMPNISPDFGIPIQKSRSHCVRLNPPHSLLKEIEIWKKSRIQGQSKGHRSKRKSACSAAHAENTVIGVTYVYTAMVTAGHLKPNYDYSVASMIDASKLEDIIERELNQEFPWRPLAHATLFEYLTSWKLFVRGNGHDTEPLTEIIGDFSAFENIKYMSTSRRQWCEKFLTAHDKQVAFLGLPNELLHLAKSAMQSYGTGSQHEKDAAIALGIGACAAAIWTSLPLRISTLLRLTYGNKDSDVQLHNARNGLVLTTPPDIVKNGYSHRAITLTKKKGGDPHEIVSWFVSTVRPLLLSSHIAPHLRMPNQLFCGVSYARLASIWRNSTLNAGVPMTPHQVRHALATLMANQPGADYAVIASLLGDTETTVRKHYVFVDQAKKHEEGQSILAKLQGSILVRGAAR